MQGISIAGRKVNDGIDFYATPDWAVDKILEVAKLEGIVMEPCSGNGACRMARHSGKNYRESYPSYGYHLSFQTRTTALRDWSWHISRQLRGGTGSI